MPVWLIGLGVVAVLAWVARAQVERALGSLAMQPGQSILRVSIDPATWVGDMGAFQLDPTEVLAVTVYQPPAGYAWSYTVAPISPPTSGGAPPPPGPPPAPPPTLVLGAHDNTGATFTPPMPLTALAAQGPQGLPSSSLITAALVPATSGAPLKSYVLRVASGSSPMPAPLADAIHPGNVLLTDGDSGAPPLVAQTAILRLSVDPSTGDQWSLDTTKTQNMTIIGHRVDPPAAGAPAGSLSTSIWEFQRTAQSGTGVLDLLNTNDPTAPPAKSFSVTIMAQTPMPPAPPVEPVPPPVPAPTSVSTSGLLLSDGDVMQTLGTIFQRR